MGFWDRVRTRLFGDDGPDPVAPEQPADITPETADPQPEALEAVEAAEPDPLTADPESVAEPEPGTEPVAAESDLPTDTPADDAGAVAARQERAAGRILEDERLRGDLTDDEFQPLLDWALGVTDHAAAGTAGLDDEQADAQIEVGLATIRNVVSAAGAAIVAHNEGDGERLASELAFIGSLLVEAPVGGVSGEAPGRLSAVAEQLASRPELSGPEVAAQVVGALGDAPPSADAGAQGDRQSADEGGTPEPAEVEATEGSS